MRPRHYFRDQDQDQDQGSNPQNQDQDSENTVSRLSRDETVSRDEIVSRDFPSLCTGVIPILSKGHPVSSEFNELPPKLYQLSETCPTQKDLKDYLT